MPRHFLAGVVLVLCLSSCDSDNNTFIIDGDWETFGPVALAGDCCEISLQLRDAGGTITGSGDVIIPGTDVGDIVEYRVLVSGTYDGTTLALSLTAQQTLVSTLNARMAPANEWYDMVADFDGYGVSASRIPFFRDL